MRALFPFLMLLGSLVASTTFAQTAEPIRITANTLNVQHNAGKATFTGNVRLVQGPLILTANRLEARYNRGLETLTATGNVQFERGAANAEGSSETARGENATYTPATQTLTLTGPEVVLQRGPSTLVGDKLVYNLATQMAQVTKQGGLVEATFIPQN
jgi:lipopolysaccharide export system protein LptA